MISIYNIKKLAASLVLVLLVCNMQIANAQTPSAQKVYSTKTGQIFFNATGGAVAIAAVNNQVDSKFVDATGQIIFGVLVNRKSVV